MSLTAEVQAVVDTLNQAETALTDLPLATARAEYVKLLAQTGGEPVAMGSVENLSLAARDAGWPLALQVLIYPVTDLRESARDYPSRVRNAIYPPLTDTLMNWFHDLSVDGTTNPWHWRVSPLLAASVAGTASTLVVTGGADILMDDGVLYVARLADDGVAVDHAHYPGVIHGFLEMHDWLTVTTQALDRIAGGIRAALNIS